MDTPDKPVQVIVRVRPELIHSDAIQVTGNSVVVQSSDKKHSLSQKATAKQALHYEFTSVHGPESTQQDVYGCSVAKQTQDLLEGKNGFVVACGGSDTGKTYTMFATRDEPGLIHRSARHILQHKEPGKFLRIRAQAYEVRNEQVLDILFDRNSFQAPSASPFRRCDTSRNGQENLNGSTSNITEERSQSNLLQRDSSKSPLPAGRLASPTPFQRSSSITGYHAQMPTARPQSAYNQQLSQAHGYVAPIRQSHAPPHEGANGKILDQSTCSWHSVDSIQAWDALMEPVVQSRLAHSTSNEHHSSRSHVFVTLEVAVYNSHTTERLCKAQLTFCDLASSEPAHSKDRMEVAEIKQVNRSLRALRRVVEGLKAKDQAIAYRDSKLTQLLKGGLSGKSNTVMVVCISPHPEKLEETRSSLEFAGKAHSIQRYDILPPAPTAPITSTHSRFSGPQMNLGLPVSPGASEVPAPVQESHQRLLTADTTARQIESVAARLRRLCDYSNAIKEVGMATERLSSATVELDDLHRRLALQRFDDQRKVNPPIASTAQVGESVAVRQFQDIIRTKKAEERRLRVGKATAEEKLQRLEQDIQRQNNQRCPDLAADEHRQLLGFTHMILRQLMETTLAKAKLALELAELERRFLEMADAMERMEQVVTAVAQPESRPTTNDQMKREAASALAVRSVLLSVSDKTGDALSTALHDEFLANGRSPPILPQDDLSQSSPPQIQPAADMTSRPPIALANTRGPTELRVMDPNATAAGKFNDLERRAQDAANRLKELLARSGDRPSPS